MRLISERLEWLETDGLGGFASGTSAGIRTRRYHALLLAAATPPTGRQVLVAGADVEIVTNDGTFALSSQRYVPDVMHPDGASRIAAFSPDPWPHWTYRIGDDVSIEHALFVPRDLPVTVLRWRATASRREPLRLRVRPFLAGRDYHSLHHENGAFRFDCTQEGPTVRWEPYPGVVPVLAASNGAYTHQPTWYRNFDYPAERERGLDSLEDLVCPGTFELDLSQGDAVLLLGADTPRVGGLFRESDPTEIARALTETELQRRASFERPLLRAADAYVVRRGAGSTLVAGYPWFTDWGRDTFIAVRGLCLATRRYVEARQILLAWTDAVSHGMLPNRFADAGESPEFNSVDASLWFIVAAHELLEADSSITAPDRTRLQTAIERILDGYTSGTRYGIRADEDGLLAAGVPGVQLTWMDAKVGDRVITPRIGKPVEVQALWINALWIAAHFCERWKEPFARAFRSFDARFWNDAAGALYDVVDVDHVAGRVSAECRPNQILAIGGLPLALLEGDRARRVVDAVEHRLWTPVGLRSLAPGEPGYCGRYAGGVESRDGAYHQGTVWPWLLGPFVEAWVRTRGNTPDVRTVARSRFLTPLLGYLERAGLGHLPEVADGDAPHDPGGCPFQAWSLGEALRLDLEVLTLAAEPRADTVEAVTHPTPLVRS